MCLFSRPFSVSRKVHNPPALPDFDNFFTQTSQKDIGSSQIFWKNSELFSKFTSSSRSTRDNVKENSFWQEEEVALDEVQDFPHSPSQFSAGSFEDKQLADSPVLFSQKSSLDLDVDEQDLQANTWGKS